jgi:3-dehydroquinate synthase II
MKQVWVRIDPWDKELVTAALEAGVDALVLPEGFSAQAKALGLVTTVAPDGDLRPGAEVAEVTITDKASERLAERLGQAATVIVTATDWSIIPWENLIAGGARVMARVTTASEALTAVTTLERGTAGVVLVTQDPDEIRRTVAAVKSEAEQAALETVTVTEVRAVGMGDRVCLDTCANMAIGEGMLVGNSSSALFLVQAECVENPYVGCRPFRVNAGPVHAYVRVPGGRTRYLSELESGDEALVVDSRGHTHPTVVGRSKVEKRPLLLVKARSEGREVSAILQNAETIRLVTPEGKPISVVELAPGAQVLACLGEAGVGRHFGMAVEETIKER